MEEGHEEKRPVKKPITRDVFLIYFRSEMFASEKERTRGEYISEVTECASMNSPSKLVSVQYDAYSSFTPLKSHDGTRKAFRGSSSICPSQM